MKEVIKEMLDHPIASVIIIGVFGSTVKGIISAVRGTTQPFINLNIEEKKPEYKTSYRDYHNLYAPRYSKKEDEEVEASDEKTEV